MTDPTPKPAPRWAVIELFGHQRIAGAVTEHFLAGTAFVRVTVPEIQYRELVAGVETTCTIAEHVRDFKPGAIHSVFWCDQQAAEIAAHTIRHRLRFPFQEAARSAGLDELPTRAA